MTDLNPAEQIVRDALGETDAHTYNGMPHDLEALARRTAAKLRDHARATTPGDDRGRELADDPRVRSLIAGSLDQAWRAGATGELGGTSERTDAVLRGLRALAAPAENEAGGDEPPELWWHRDHGVLLPTVADGVDYGWHVLGSSTWLDERPSDAVRLAAATPEGGQG